MLDTGGDQIDSTQDAVNTQAMTPDERGYAAAISGTDEPLLPPEIKGYRINRRIGWGGMGSVYEAEQGSPRRLVALKILRPESFTPERRRRFEHEAEILGRFQHPGIGRIYEAGSFDSGHGVRPFFAMELIRGNDLLKHAESKELDAMARMELLAQICDAVQHANAAGIIHRDLKPENILVDETGQPKVVDFGVARAVETDPNAPTLQTRAGFIVGTLAYMSPEQAAGQPDDIDARCDVYALGVIGYQLLSNQLPHDLRGLGLVEAARVIREETPPTLSSINRLCRGDLETIIGKALEKDRDRRYQTAAELGADIRRYLRNEPIVARPPGTFYQLSKFAARNKSLVAGVVAAFFALLLGLIGTSWQAANARRQRDRADSEARRAEAESARSREEAKRAKSMFDFTIAMMDDAGHLSDTDEEFTLLGLLDTGGHLIGERFKDEPLGRAQLHYQLGHLYQRVPRQEKSLEQFHLALNSLDQVTSPPQELYVEIYMSLGSFGIGHGEDEAACVEYTRKGAALARKIDTTPFRRANAESCLVSALLDTKGYEEGLETARRWIAEIPTQKLDPRRERARYLCYEATFLTRLGRPKEALGPSGESMEICRSLEFDPATESDHWLRWCFEARNDVLAALKDNAAQERLFEEFGPQMRKGSLFVQLCFAEVVSKYLDRVKPTSEEGIPAKEEWLELTKRVNGERTMKTVYVYTDLIMALWKRNRLEEAKTRAVEALEIMRTKLGPDSPELIERLENYAMALTMRGRNDLALALLDAYAPAIEEKHGRGYPEGAKLYALWDKTKKKAADAAGK